MADNQPVQLALGDSAARQLANATKTAPTLSTITPRWLVHLLQWVPVEAGIYRLNKVRNPQDVQVLCVKRDESELPTTFVDYDEKPREYFLNAVSTVLDVHTRVSTLQQPARPDQGTASPDDRDDQGEAGKRADQQPGLRPAGQRRPRAGHLPADRRAHAGRPRRAADQGLEGARVLPDPSAGDRRLRPRVHAPRRAAAHGEPVRLAVPHLARHPAGPQRQGAGGRRQDQHPAAAGRREAAGVVGLFQPGLPGEQSPGLSVRFMGISRNAIASYLISLYCSLAVHTDDALAVLEGVEVGKYHDYPDTYR